MAGAAGLVPDVCLLRINHPGHGAAATRTLVIVHGVALLADFRISGI